MPYMPYIKVEITKTEWGRGAEQVNQGNVYTYVLFFRNDNILSAIKRNVCI